MQASNTVSSFFDLYSNFWFYITAKSAIAFYSTFYFRCDLLCYNELLVVADSKTIFHLALTQSLLNANVYFTRNLLGRCTRVGVCFGHMSLLCV